MRGNSGSTRSEGLHALAAAAPSVRVSAGAGAENSVVVNTDVLLLDIDGTLVDSNGAHARAWSDAFAEAGIDAPPGRIFPMIGMGGDRLLAEFGLDEDAEPGHTIAARRSEIFRERYAASLRPTRGARALLERARDAGARLVVATSASEAEVGLLLRLAGVEDLIERAATKDDAESTKPDPDIVNAALRKAGVPADRAVLIGDTPYDCASAGRAGVTAVALRCGGWREPELTCAAVYDDPQDLLDHYETSPLR